MDTEGFTLHVGDTVIKGDGVYVVADIGPGNAQLKRLSSIVHNGDHGINLVPYHNLGRHRRCSPQARPTRIRD